MSSVAVKCAEMFDKIPKWQFWRRWEREFWLGGIIAEYATYEGGNKKLNDVAGKIHDKYEARIKKKHVTNPTNKEGEK